MHNVKFGLSLPHCHILLPELPTRTARRQQSQQNWSLCSLVRRESGSDPAGTAGIDEEILLANGDNLTVMYLSLGRVDWCVF